MRRTCAPILAIPLALAVAAPGFAAPVYLSCAITETSKPYSVEITADETQQVATVLLPFSGRAVTRKALYSPEKVEVRDEESTWVVNRVTLEIHRIVVLSTDRWDEAGKCVVKLTPAQRAF